jgi:hypothetical protein
MNSGIVPRGYDRSKYNGWAKDALKPVLIALSLWLTDRREGRKWATTGRRAIGRRVIKITADTTRRPSVD